MKQIAIIKLADELYALDIMKVNTIKEYSKPNRIPNAKPFVKGVINLRGQIVPVLDLREILMYPETDSDKRKIIIIDNEEEKLGFIIDEVLSITTVDDSQIEEIDKISCSDFSDVIESVAKLKDEKLGDQLVAILSIPKILEK